MSGFKSFLPRLNTTFSIGLGLCSVGLSLLTIKMSPDETNISLGWFLITVIVFFMICIALINVLISLWQENKNIKKDCEGPMDWPVVSTILENSGKKIICTTKSKFFTRDIEVTIYRLDEEGIEFPFCFGRVIHIQNDSNIMQIEILPSSKDENSTVDSLFQELNKIDKKNIKIVPGKIIYGEQK